MQTSLLGFSKPGIHNKSLRSKSYFLLIHKFILFLILSISAVVERRIVLFLCCFMSLFTLYLPWVK